MKIHCHSVFLAVFAALLLSGCGGEKTSSQNEGAKPSVSVVKPSGAAAECIKRGLREKGLREGVQENGLIIVGTDHAFSCKDPTSAPQFATLRERCLAKALEDAKAEIAFAISTSFSFEEIESEFSGCTMSSTETSRSMRGVGDNEEKSIRSMRRSSQLNLGGFRVLDVAESWDAETHVFEMAVAVAWSRKAQEQSKNEAEGRATPKHPLSSAELETWMDERDDGLLVGPRTVKDENGILHYLGIGTADSDGPPGKARMVSEMSAQQFAAFPRLSRIAVEDVVKESNYSRHFAETPVSDNCRFLTLGFHEAVHPVSGKKLVLAIVEALP